VKAERGPARDVNRPLRWQGERIDWAGYVFVLPILVPFVLFTLAPIGFGLFVAFTEWSIARPPQWTGLANIAAAWNDPQLRQAFGNTLRYCLIIVPCVTVLGLVFALFVNQRWPGYVFARAAFFSPYVVSATVVGIVWVWILDTQNGILNQYLGIRIPWLSSTSWSLLGVSVASVWWDVGLAFILFLAALQDIDPEVLSAAKIDGAGRVQSLRHITLPLLRPTLSLIITLQSISSLRIYSQVHLMTDGRPAGSSMSVMNYIVDFGIQRFRFGYASAIALMLFAVILIVTLVQRRLIRERVL